MCAFSAAASAQPNAAAIEQADVRTTAYLAQVPAVAGGEASIEQVGDGHAVALRQTGASIADVLQDGSSHGLTGLDGDALQADASVLLLTQLGLRHTVVLNQTGGAYARIAQSGAGNSITAIQTR